MAKKILVADDDFEQRDLYIELLKRKGYETISAVDGLEGLEKALAEKPDLVFSGIAMPRMDGFELIRNLRKNIATANVPVILFSHLGKEDDRQKSQEFPNVELMVKGLDKPNEILKRIEQMLGAPGEKTKIVVEPPPIVKSAEKKAISVKKVETKPKTVSKPKHSDDDERRTRHGAGTIIV